MDILFAPLETKSPQKSYADISDTRNVRIPPTNLSFFDHPLPLQSPAPWGGVLYFAKFGERMGTEFVNEHGVTRKTYDLNDEAQLRGDWRTTGTTDSNYLAEAVKTGNVKILPLHHADKIEVLRDENGEEAGYRVHVEDYSTSLADKKAPKRETSFSAESLFLAAGAIGTTELLLRNAQVHGTLPELSPMLGQKYGINGDRLGLAITEKPSFPYVGPINTWGVLFPDQSGKPSVFIIDGAYQDPWILAAMTVLDAVGLGSPGIERRLIAIGQWLDRHVFGSLTRVWPVPLLGMNSAPYRSMGRITLKNGRAVADLDLRANAEADRQMDDRMAQMAKAVAPRGGLFRWLNGAMIKLSPLLYALANKAEAPHNLGGVPMGRNAAEGAADHTGRLFGYEKIFVEDSSLMPPSLGKNPTETMQAVAERNMTHILFPEHRRLLTEIVDRILGGLPENASDEDLLKEIDRRVEVERVTLASQEPTGLLLRPEGKRRVKLLANIQELIGTYSDPSSRLKLELELGDGRHFRDFVELYRISLVESIARLTPETFEAAE